MELDYTALKAAVASLERNHNVVLRKQQDEDAPADELEALKDGMIQAFEYTYELSWKTLKRYLEDRVSSGAVVGISRKALFRLAAENGLIDNLEQWFAFDKARNKTSHEYGVHIAENVFPLAVMFLPIAQQLLERLETCDA